MALTKEQATRFGKLYRGEIEITDPVYLKTVHVEDGRVVWSGVFEKEYLQGWYDRAITENSQDCVRWSIHKEKGEEL